MHILKSSQACPQLRPYVRAYAQRILTPQASPSIESVPAQLEQVLNLELGTLPGIRHRQHAISSITWIGGAQTSFPGYVDLKPGVESFAIFFRPAGWSLLFKTPMRAITNHIADAADIMGSCVRSLWNRVGEEPTFSQRITLVEHFLLERLRSAAAAERNADAASYLFTQHGAIPIAKLASLYSLGLRQFERQFEREVGAPPKIFARVARFQAALDAKLAAANRSWLDIAHSFGYYDQMHMIHDFKKLGRCTPAELVLQLGDVRPPALASSQT